MAALLVKKFILPMFESDGKKIMKGTKANLNNKMAGIGALTGKNLKAGKFNEAEQHTVYGELKLSEKLQAELSSVRDKVYSLNEQLEQIIYERDSQRALIREQKQKIVKYQRDLVNERRTVMKLKQDAHDH